MQIFKSTNFNFIGSRNIAFIFSGLLILATIVSIVVQGGLNSSIDFAGGTLLQIRFEKPVDTDLAAIRLAIDKLDYGKPEIKTIGTSGQEIQIVIKKTSKSPEGESLIADEIRTAIEQDYPGNSFELRRQETVGPKIGGELQKQGLIAGALSLLIIVIYVGLRFHFPFGIASIVALFHDVLITIGVFSIVGAEFSLPIIGALLTIIGYSLNDTIVVFDRIRENLGGSAVKRSFEDKVNNSINQCLSRTIITSLTTFLVVVTIFITFFHSGDVIADFALALLVGVIIGTYSSVFIASPVLVLWNKKWPIK